jgi:hypothetical protein
MKGRCLGVLPGQGRSTTPFMTSGEKSMPYLTETGRQNPSLVKEIADILYRFDPMGVAYPDCEDEYTTEAEFLLSHLSPTLSVEEIEAELCQLMIVFFDAERLERMPRPPFRRSAEAIWKLING